MHTQKIAALVILLLALFELSLLGGCSFSEPAIGAGWQVEWVDQSQVTSIGFSTCEIAVDSKNHPHIA